MDGAVFRSGKSIPNRRWPDPLFETYPAVVVRPDRLIFGVVDVEHGLDRQLVEVARKLSLSVR